MMKSLLGSLISICAIFAIALPAQVVLAGVIDVTYTVSGSAGNYDLNFTVQNNLPGPPVEDIYFFGVKLSSPGTTNNMLVPARTSLTTISGTKLDGTTIAFWPGQLFPDSKSTSRISLPLRL